MLLPSYLYSTKTFFVEHPSWRTYASLIHHIKVSHNIEQLCNILVRLEPEKNDKNTQNFFAILRVGLRLLAITEGLFRAFFNFEFPS
jgi:hypothetical protein